MIFMEYGGETPNFQSDVLPDFQRLRMVPMRIARCNADLQIWMIRVIQPRLIWSVDCRQSLLQMMKLFSTIAGTILTITDVKIGLGMR